MKKSEKCRLISASLARAYPEFIISHDDTAITWKDGQRMIILPESLENNGAENNNSSLYDQFRWDYPTGGSSLNAPGAGENPGRIRYEPLFKKMYGATREEVENKLTTISWMPKSTKKSIQVTSVNGVDKKLVAISDELDKLPGSLKKYVKRISGTYNWRMIDGTTRLSTHSFGIAIDLSLKYAQYWKWDIEKNGIMLFKNSIPNSIVEIFEKQGFIWGGKWHNYDTMHFEYRPEFFMINNLKGVPQKHNVLYLTQGRELYGSQRQLSYLVQNINKTIFTPFIVHSEPMERHGFDCVPDNNFALMKLRPWRKIRNLFFRYIDAYRLLRLAQNNNIQLIHCSYQWLYPYARWVGKRLDIPVVQHIRRPGTTGSKSRRLGYDKAHAIIAISKRIEQELKKIVGLKDKIHRIDDAVDNTFFSNDKSSLLRDEFHLSAGLIYGLVGRIYKSKRQLEFVKAAHELVKNEIDAYFFIIGRVDDDLYSEKIKSYIDKNKLNKRIFLTGHRCDMAEVVSSLDVLVSLSGGSVMYEGMASSKAVISASYTKKENSHHLIDRATGLVTDSKDIHVIAAMMEELAKNEGLRREIGINAHEWAKKHFCCKEIAIKTEQVYIKILEIHK